MSDYGPPGGSPGGSLGPQNPYGAGPAGYPGSPPAAAPKPAGDPAQLTQMIGYAAAGLGLLAFVWGFLGWISVNGTSQTGFATTGAAAIGLSIAAGLLAGGAVLENKDVTLVPAALAGAALLVVVGQLISHGDGYSVSIGMILTLITTIVQTGALAYGWLVTSGRMAAPSSAPKPQQNQWGGPSQGGPSQGGPAQGGYGQQGYPTGGGYGQGGGQYQPPSAPSAPSTPQSYSQPGSYGPPSGVPGYGPPSQSGTTSSMPTSSPYSPPPPQQSQTPQQPSSQPESGGGYGEPTRNIPRYTGPGSSTPGSDDQPPR